MNRIKLFFITFLAIMTVGMRGAVAQDSGSGREYRSAVQVSFFPPLSTNGLHSGRYTNGVSFNIIAGLSGNEEIFTLGGVGNIILNDASGFQIAGVVNHVGGEGRGFQIGGVANITAENFKGFQLGGVFNTSDDLAGFQLGGAANISRNVHGSQLGGVANIARDVHGHQFAGVINVARDVAGFQFAGVVNKARRVSGAQFAVVNIAEKNDCPIGLVNIIKEGEMGIALGYNEIGTASLTFRSGGRVMYGILGLGYNHKVEKSRKAWTMTGGFGAHINILPWLRINNELTTESIGIFGTDNNTFKTGYAMLPALRFGHFELFGGPSINFMQSRDADMFGVFQEHSFWERHRGSRLQQVFLGWQVGVQAIF
jgi:hypothetical protein